MGYRDVGMGAATGRRIWSAAGWQDVTPQGVNAHIMWGSRHPDAASSHRERRILECRDIRPGQGARSRKPDSPVLAADCCRCPYPHQPMTRTSSVRDTSTGSATSTRPRPIAGSSCAPTRSAS